MSQKTIRLDDQKIVIRHSKKWRLTWYDGVKGVIMAALSGSLATFQQLLHDSADILSPHALRTIGYVALSGAVAYLLKNFFTDSKIVKKVNVEPGSNETKNVGWLLPDYDTSIIATIGSVTYPPGTTASNLVASYGYFMSVNDDNEKVLCKSVPADAGSIPLTLVDGTIIQSQDFIGGRPPRRPH